MHVSRIRAGFVMTFVCAFGVWPQLNAAPPTDKDNAPVDRQTPQPPPSSRAPDLEEMLAKPITPSPEVPIPDDPPPHEGGMFELPYVIEAPDLLIVEVLESLPDRPITGEHLVRQDGTISLGFYGDVHVQGLTMRQAKTKIIQHLRKILSDHALGLVQVVGGEEDVGAEKEGMTQPNAVLPVPPPEIAPPVDPKEPADRRSNHGKGPAARPSRGPARRGSPHPPRAAAAPSIRIRLVQGSVATEEKTKEAVPAEPAEGVVGAGTVVVIAPEDSLAVSVDIGSYNSKFYFVQGDTAATGRFPWTGRETVLDAINNSGGFIPTADARNIRLVRPARGGKPAHVYPIDFQAILEKGDRTANLQIFPGDRLVVGRDPLVKTSIAVDRTDGAVHSALTSMLRASAVDRALFPPSTRTIARLQFGGLTWTLEAAGEEKGVTSAQREETVKAWIEFWSKAAAQAGAPDGDDALLREALRRHLMPVAPEHPGKRE